jgi:hypothetical protein
VRIDAAAGKAAEAKHASVTGLQKNGEAWQWAQLDEALPMPVAWDDPVMKLAVDSSEFIAALNQQPLVVSGLAAGNYDLKIDGQLVGPFTAAQLGAGVNLATLATPMAKQAAEVHRLTLRRCDIHNARWRTVEVPLAADFFTTASTAMKALDDLDEEIRGRQRNAARPVPRRYELSPAK